MSRYAAGWATQGNFKTDSNGRELLARQYNHRPSYNASIQEPIGKNLYCKCWS
jgi:hypothetical protein